MEKNENLLIAVEKLSVIQDRYDHTHSDSTGTSTGDDGEGADKLNHPE